MRLFHRVKTTDLAHVVTYIDRVNIDTATPAIQRNLHLTSTEPGFAFAAFACPYAFFQIVGGWLGDHLGLRKTLPSVGTPPLPKAALSSGASMQSSF